MKKKYVAVSIGLAVSIMVAGCEKTTTQTGSNTDVVSESTVETETIYGKVTAVNGSEITVKEGTISSFADSMGAVRHRKVMPQQQVIMLQQRAIMQQRVIMPQRAIILQE